MGRLGLVIVLLAALVPGCSLAEQASPATPTSGVPAGVTPALTPAPSGPGRARCGDGVCDERESTQTCPQDCQADVSPGAQENTYWVTNPTSGAALFMQVIYPGDWDGQPLPALVLIPGGTGDSRAFASPASDTGQAFADQGFAVVVFDPDGRGQSEGLEDQNGFVHQDGLAAVIRTAAALHGIDDGRIGLVSWSYGVTMAAGVLARYDDLPVRFLIDWEGPANRDDTGGCSDDQVGHLQGHPCDDEEFWREREASTFALSIRVPYQRLQSERDHAQPDSDHALLMIANATAAQYGGHGQSPWTRLNDLAPNTVYDYDAAPPMMLEVTSQMVHRLMVQYALELFSEH